MIELIAITGTLVAFVVVLTYIAHLRLQGVEEKVQHIVEILEETVDALKPLGTSEDSSESKPKKKNLQPLAKLIYMRVLKAQKHQIEVSVLSKETGYSEKEIREAAFESFQLGISWDGQGHAGYVTFRT